MDLVLRPLPPGDLEESLEIVEHKGIGHPDTMCDGIVEAFAVGLARFYLERCGRPLHFNVDKALLVGGAARPAFGGGEIVAPIQVLLGGRATREVDGVRVPVDDIAREACAGWIRAHVHALDPDRHVTSSCLVRGGSEELVQIFASRGPEDASRWLANDTSIGVGYAPFSRLERAVLTAADRLRQLARERPEVGEDVKVMGLRRGADVHLTVACAFIGKHLADIEDYAARKDAVRRDVVEAVRRCLGGEATVDVNAADDLSAGRAYVTVTGTSAEAGDDGQVGRGNRVNGLITPYRPMSLEAAAGKNPTSHVGKLYNVVAQRIAAAVIEHVADVTEAHCVLLSRIGRPVTDPVLADMRVRTRDHVPVDAVRAEVLAIVHDGIASLPTLAREILSGGVRLF
jgi:S-adenosylmethionine synthetase